MSLRPQGALPLLRHCRRKGAELTIILEPDLFDSQISNSGIHPDQSRNRLIFTANGEKGIGVPFSDWGFDFSDNIPKEISDAIIKARGDAQGALEDEEYRKRLQDNSAAGGSRLSSCRRSTRSPGADRANEPGGSPAPASDQASSAAVTGIVRGRCREDRKGHAWRARRMQDRALTEVTTYVAEDQFDLTYRNEAALTVSLMGLLAEESLIAQGLGKLGRKKNAA
jgi:hypothetical protein